jgi:hypothetical protein
MVLLKIRTSRTNGLVATVTLHLSFSHATIATALNKEKTWQQAVFTEVAQQTQSLLPQARKVMVCMVVAFLLVAHTLSGLYFKSQRLSQRLLQAVLGALQPIQVLLHRDGHYNPL